MPARRSARTRLVAVALAVLVSTVALAPAALAKEQGIWSQWADQVTDREINAEVPFAIVLSIPAMVIVTPIWLGGKALGAVTDD